MKSRQIETFVILTCLFVTIVESIPFIFPLRIMGQNILNARLWQYLAVAVILLGNSKVFFRKSLKAVYLCTIIYVLLELMGQYDLQAGRVSRFVWLYWQHFSLGFCLLLREHYSCKERANETKTIINSIFLFYLIAFVLNIYVIIGNSSAVRGFDSAFSGENDIIYRTMGLSGYGFVSSIPFLIPIAVYKFRQSLHLGSNKMKLFWILFIVIAILSSYLSVIVAPFLLSVILLILSIMGRTRLKNNSVIIVIIVLIFIIVPKHYTADLVRRFASMSSNKEVNSKFFDLADTIEGGVKIVEESEAVGSVEGRTARIDVNIKRFVKSPIIGQGTSGSGEHLYWLNLFAQFGLVGAVPFIMIFIIAWRKDSVIKIEGYRFFYFLSISGFIVLGFMKVIVGINMFLIPLLLAPIVDSSDHNAVLGSKD